MSKKIYEILNQKISDQEKILQIEALLKEEPLCLNNLIDISFLSTLANIGAELIKWLLEKKPELISVKSEVDSNLLFYAAKYANKPVTDYLSQFHPDLALAINHNLYSSLAFAAFGGNIEILLALQKIRRDWVFSTGTTNETTFRGILSDVIQDGHLAMVQFLYEKVLDEIPDFKYEDLKYHGYYPVHWAATAGKIDIIKCLVQSHNYGINLRADSEQGESPLALLIQAGHPLAAVKELIQLGANVNRLNKNNVSPLMLAVMKGDLVLVKFLVEEANAEINRYDKMGWHVIHYAAQEKHLPLLLYFIKDKNIDIDLQEKNEYGNTALHEAVRVGDLTIVKELIELKADYTSFNKAGSHPLHHATTKGHWPVIEYFLDEAKMDINLKLKTDTESTPMHLAAQNGYLEIMTKLIAREANFNDANKKGWLPSHNAASEGHADVVNFLVKEKNVDVNLKTQNGNTVFNLAACWGQLEVLKLLSQLNAKTNEPNNHGSYAIHLAADDNYTEVIKYLVKEEKMDINTPNVMDNETCLHIAARRGFLETVKVAMDLGADHDRYNSQNGNTPLHTAVEHGHLHVVKYFIEERNIAKNLVSKNSLEPRFNSAFRNFTPLQLALLYGKNTNQYDLLFYLCDRKLLLEDDHFWTILSTYNSVIASGNHVPVLECILLAQQESESAVLSKRFIDLNRDKKHLESRKAKKQVALFGTSLSEFIRANQTSYYTTRQIEKAVSILIPILVSRLNNNFIMINNDLTNHILSFLMPEDIKFSATTILTAMQTKRKKSKMTNDTKYKHRALFFQKLMPLTAKKEPKVINLTVDKESKAENTPSSKCIIS